MPLESKDAANGLRGPGARPTPTIIRLSAALGAQTVGTADNTLTGKINGVAMVHDTWKQPTSGSAAYEIDSANASPLAPANHVQAGDSIQFTSEGAGSNTTPTMFTALIRMA